MLLEHVEKVWRRGHTIATPVLGARRAIYEQRVGHIRAGGCVTFLTVRDVEQGLFSNGHHPPLLQKFFNL